MTASLRRSAAADAAVVDRRRPVGFVFEDGVGMVVGVGVGIVVGVGVEVVLEVGVVVGAGESSPPMCNYEIDKKTNYNEINNCYARLATSKH